MSIQFTIFFIDFNSFWPLIFTKPLIRLGPIFFGFENMMKYNPWDASTFLIIKGGERPIQKHLFSLNIDVLLTKQLRDICFLLFYPHLDFLGQKKKLLCANQILFTIFYSHQVASYWLYPVKKVIIPDHVKTLLHPLIVRIVIHMAWQFLRK